MKNTMKYMLCLYGLIIIQFLCTPKFYPQENPGSRTIYLIKNYWHVGILMDVDSLSSILIPPLKNFNNFKMIDIGWGDEDFYQAEGTDYYFAAKAILIPTPSVIRISGFNIELSSIINWSDFCVQVQLSSSQFRKLCEYISSSFMIENSNYITTSEKSNGTIRFYKSVHKYHLFNTCNTWIASTLESSGLKISADGIITSDDLFSSLLGLGVVLKYEE